MLIPLPFCTLTHIPQTTPRTTRRTTTTTSLASPRHSLGQASKHKRQPQAKQPNPSPMHQASNPPRKALTRWPPSEHWGSRMAVAGLRWCTPPDHLQEYEDYGCELWCLSSFGWWLPPSLSISESAATSPMHLICLPRLLIPCHHDNPLLTHISLLTIPLPFPAPATTTNTALV